MDRNSQFAGTNPTLRAKKVLQASDFSGENNAKAFEIDADISEKSSRGKVCSAVIIGGIGCVGLVALVVVVAMAAGLTGGIWWLAQQGTSSDDESGPPPSEMLGSEFQAELESSSSSGGSSRLRRRLAYDHHDGFVALSSGTQINANKLIAAGKKNAAGKSSFSEATPAFLEGVAAHMKTDTALSAISTADTSELLGTLGRTLVRVQVKKELAPCSKFFKDVLTSALGSIDSASPCNKCATQGLHCCGEKSNYQCWKDSSSECAHLKVGGDSTANPGQTQGDQSQSGGGSAHSDCQHCWSSGLQCCGLKSNFQCWAESSSECAHLQNTGTTTDPTNPGQTSADQSHSGGTAAATSCQPCFKAGKNCCGVKSNYQCWTSSSSECSHLSNSDVGSGTTSPGNTMGSGRRRRLNNNQNTDELYDPLTDWTLSGGTRTKDKVTCSCKKDNIEAYKSAISSELQSRPWDAKQIRAIITRINAEHPTAKGFYENMINISSSLAAVDCGISTATDTISSMDAVTKGLVSGFDPRTDDTEDGVSLYDHMDQHAMDYGIGNLTEGLSALAINTNLLGDAGELEKALAGASAGITAQAIKTAADKSTRASKRKSDRPVVKDTLPPVIQIVTTFKPSLDRVAAGSVNAVVGIDKAFLPKDTATAVLKNVAGSIVTTMSAGKNKDGNDLDIDENLAKITKGMGESATGIPAKRDDIPDFEDGVIATMDGMLEAVSKLPVDRTSKANIPTLVATVVDKLTESVLIKTGMKKSALAQQLHQKPSKDKPVGTHVKAQQAMEKLAEAAAENTAYISINRPDFTPSELGDISSATASKIVERVLSTDSVDDMGPVIESMARGLSFGAGKNSELTDATLLSDYIVKQTQGSTAGLSSGATKSKNAAFAKVQQLKTKAGNALTDEDKRVQGDMATMVQLFMSTMSGGAVQGALGITKTQFTTSAFEDTYQKVLEAQVDGSATLAESLDYFNAQHIANATRGITSSAAASLGKRKFKGNALTTAEITEILKKGNKGCVDGLNKIDTAKVPSYTQEIFTTAISDIVQGTVDGVDEMNRNGNGPTISANDFKSIKDGASTDIINIAKPIGSSKWGGGFNQDDVTDAVLQAEADAVKNVTSISGFNPIQAIGDVSTFCGRIKSQGRCTGHALKSFCQWTASTCVERPLAGGDMCDIAQTKKDCLRTGRWCKWVPAGGATGGACAIKVPTEVGDDEKTRTHAPTTAPTYPPTSKSSPVDMCKICMRQKLDWVMVESDTCSRFMHEQCDMQEFSHANVMTKSQKTSKCSYSQVQSACPGVALCAKFCKSNYGYDFNTGKICCAAYIAECLACNVGMTVEDYCAQQTEPVPGCDGNGGVNTLPPTTAPPTKTPGSDDTSTGGGNNGTPPPTLQPTTMSPTTKELRRCRDWLREVQTSPPDICGRDSIFLFDHICGSNCDKSTCCKSKSDLDNEPSSCRAWMQSIGANDDVCANVQSILPMVFHPEYKCGSSFPPNSQDFYDYPCGIERCCETEVPKTPTCRDYRNMCTPPLYADPMKFSHTCTGGCTPEMCCKRMGVRTQK
jgi:hypothetical protein